MAGGTHESIATATIDASSKYRDAGRPVAKEYTMKWDDSFTIGIESIDAQHKKIFEHLLALENSVAKRDSWHILQFFLAQLTEYMKFHLAVEEALLDAIRFPARADHCASHERLVDQIAKLEDQLKRKASAENLVDFFENWFVDHVLSGDREYVAYIRKKFPDMLGRSMQ
jgi:hemerythrin-like metal-binding protein